MRTIIRAKRTVPLLALALTLLAGLITPAAASATSPPRHRIHLLTSGLQGGLGSTVGPGGVLYVTEGEAGKITRVDPRTGHTSTFARGLPKRIASVGVGGAMDIAFVHQTAYVLVTLVGPDVGGTDVVGIYRIDGKNRATVIADIGSWSIAHPPTTDFFVPSGVQYAMQSSRGGLLVTDGHHNRLLWVSLDGGISQIATLPNVAPTGLDLRHHRVYLAEAGPVPHLPADGKIVTVTRRSPVAREIASGAPLLVDVEFGPDGKLYALSQGHFTPGHPEGSPADPDTGTLQRVDRSGTMSPVATGLDRPTSVEIIGHRAYVVTLDGEIWSIALPR
jgi:sugar lactone lactonase YvrE